MQPHPCRVHFDYIMGPQVHDMHERNGNPSYLSFTMIDYIIVLYVYNKKIRVTPSIAIGANTLLIINFGLARLNNELLAPLL